MVMTHYMELLSLHEPWFLILFMLVPMVLAETILAAGAFSLLYKDSRSEKWDSLSHVCGLILGVFFIVATVYIVTSYVPTIQWRGPIDYISIWAYVLGVIPAVLILLQELVIFKGLDTTAKIKKHIVLMILFVLFTHLAMVFGMADPQLAGYVPPKQNMQMQMNGNMPMDHSQMDHSQMNHDQMNGQMNGQMNNNNGQMDHSKM